MTASAFFLFCCAWAASAQPMRVEEDVFHEGQRAIRVTTPAATWVYHAEGAGFASLYDREGKDWISYHPGQRSAGEFRGIPNLGLVNHPGYDGDKGARTVIEKKSAGHVRLRSVTKDEKWVTVWDIYVDRAQLTIEKAGDNYWFLYEGTPAGRLHLEAGYWGLPDGRRRPLTDTWNADIAGPEWVYFGDTSSRRVLYLINHQDDTANDQFWQMEGNMTVWGFGRQYRCCGRFLTAAPARFTVGFAETTDFRRIQRQVRKVIRAR
jgi:hypothetical protein